MDAYLAVNKASWDARSVGHAKSETYDINRYINDANYLSGTVRFDLARLPDLHGLSGVHLQCHIGTDTISLARLGARMTGLDLSSTAIAEARILAHRSGTPAEFVESDVESALEVLPREAFDFVYTGVGALCWLRHIGRWAEVVAGLLRPGGWVFVREGHPMLWAIDEARQDRLELAHPYFEQSDSRVIGQGTSYVEDSHYTHAGTHEWNHGLGEIITALTRAGMALTELTEHDSVPWNALPGRMSMDAHGEWRLTERPERLAASYTLRARRH